MHKQIILSATVMVLIAGLSACGKHSANEIRSKTMDAPTPTADPSKAMADDKVATEKLAAESAKHNAEQEQNAAAGKEKLPADPALVEDLKKTAATNQATLDELALAMDRGDEATAAKLAEAQAALAKSTAALEAALDNKAPVAPEVTSASVGEMIPAKTETTPPKQDVKVGDVLPVISETELANRKAFVISLIEPSILANTSILRRRVSVEELGQREKAKTTFIAKETEWLETMRTEYKCKGASIPQLLKHVDLVSLPFLIAPIALKTQWGKYKSAPDKTVIEDHIIELNVSESNDKVRFREARALSRTNHSQTVDVDLMKALLDVKPDSTISKDQATLIATTEEIVMMFGDLDVQKEIKRATAKVYREYKIPRLK